MSSQGVPGLTGYTYGVTRDASDRTRAIKEAIQYKTQKTSYSGNKNTEPIWMKYGNQFKLPSVGLESFTQLLSLSSAFSFAHIARLICKKVF